MWVFHRKIQFASDSGWPMMAICRGHRSRVLYELHTHLHDVIKSTYKYIHTYTMYEATYGG